MPWGSRRPLLAAQGSLARPRAPWCRMAGAQENTKIYCILVIFVILAIRANVLVAGSNWRCDQGYGPFLKRCQGYLILLVVVVLLISWSYVHKLHITHCILHLAPCTLHIAHITHCILHTLPICWSLVHPLGPTLPSRCSRPHLDHLLSFKPSSIHPTQSSQVQMNGKSRLRKYCSKWDRPYWWWAIIAKIFANQVSGGCRRNCLHLSDKIPLGFPPFFLCRI